MCYFFCSLCFSQLVCMHFGSWDSCTEWNTVMPKGEDIMVGISIGLYIIYLYLPLCLSLSFSMSFSVSLCICLSICLSFSLFFYFSSLLLRLSFPEHLCHGDKVKE